MHRTTLEQWRMLQAVVEHGGFAQAAAAVHKSQSTINHAVHKLQDQLGLPLLEVVGRKAQLTEAGELMLRRAQQLLAQAEQIEEVAASLATGVEAEVRVAVDEIYPYLALADVLQSLSDTFPNTRVQLYETVLSGGAELLTAGIVDLLVTGSTPDGFLGEPLMRAEFVAVAHPDHPLHGLGRELSLQDLQRHRQIVVRDSARSRSVDSGWLGAEQRWTVSHLATSVAMIERGMGFAWLPLTRARAALEAGRLRELPLGARSRRYAELYLVYADPDRAGPVVCRLGELLASACADYPEPGAFTVPWDE
ncbi:LysR family transcriptional regulator [Mangrovimicrobium sediminis]|uniref:LysR family transcriptional regulator n=1 Tax=Mangrovimicrobium sediminis TaxID=2562682 RepID=A0A4Z0M8M7_9GAMM|nr:LysR family transcriptional regulator [Haliea sp. SAOS-164]TGD75737.1 LysR family transcriptional regulator [Haliea sp. SAOS-164]